MTRTIIDGTWAITQVRQKDGSWWNISLEQVKAR